MNSCSSACIHTLQGCGTAALTKMLASQGLQVGAVFVKLGRVWVGQAMASTYRLGSVNECWEALLGCDGKWLHLDLLRLYRPEMCLLLLRKCCVGPFFIPSLYLTMRIVISFPHLLLTRVYALVPTRQFMNALSYGCRCWALMWTLPLLSKEAWQLWPSANYRLLQPDP